MQARTCYTHHSPNLKCAWAHGDVTLLDASTAIDSWLDVLPGYITDLGFTHVEFMPILEHRFDGSWSYQAIGHFAPTSRFGSPGDLRFLIDQLHQANIGAILDMRYLQRSIRLLVFGARRRSGCAYNATE